MRVCKLKMCNINLILRKDGKDTNQISQYMNVVSQVSWLKNDNGEGYLARNNEQGWTFAKGLDKIIYRGRYNFIVSHQRYATTGNKEGNAHPFLTKNVLIMHNGTFYNISKGNDSDSKIFTEIFDKNYKQNKGKMIKTINDTHKEVNGTYSIVVFDRKKERLYYYKSSRRDMFLLNTPNWLIMSTLKDNLIFAKNFFDIKKPIIALNSGRIYDIFNNFKRVGMILKKPEVQTSFRYPKKTTYDDFDSYSYRDAHEIMYG